jgi:hypothetical protein
MLEDNYEIYENGNINVVRTEDKTNTYTYYKNDGTNIDLGTYNKNDKGYVDLCNGGNTGSGIGWAKTNSNAKNYLNGDVAAAFLGGAFKFSSENNNINVEVTQFTTSTGAHSGKDSYKGGAIDVKYVDLSGAAIPSTTSASFDKEKNQLLVNTFISFGFKNAPGGYNILTENSNKQPALENTKYVDVSPYEHKSHFHLQKYDYYHVKTIIYP